MIQRFPPEHVFDRMHPLRRHEYTNIDGSPFGRKDKKGDQNYTWYRYVDGEYVATLKDENGETIPAPVYRLHVVAKADEIWLVEGERDVETLEKYGIKATCGALGFTWRDEYTEYFKGKVVYISGDHDVPGRKYVGDSAKSLCKVAKVNIISLPTEFNGHKIKDITDLAEASGGEFVALLERARANATPFVEAGDEEIKGKIYKLPVVKSIWDFTPPVERDNLLGNRFLERKGSMLFVAQSGIGKSSSSVQQDMEWACGRISFGIRSNGPLKILTFQAEDTDGDIWEFREGVKKGLNLTKEEEELIAKNCLYVTYKEFTGVEFLKNIVEPYLKLHRPDIFRLNPLNSYFGKDVSDPAAVAEFCRHTLNRLIDEYDCGVILVHHTPKTTYQDKEKWKTSDWMYACTGSADLTNWARAILVIAAIEGNDRLFAWIAAKRGRRIGWVNDDNIDVCKRHFQHSDNGAIAWLPAEDVDIPAERGSKDKKGQFKTEYVDQMILERMDFIEPMRANKLMKDTNENTGMSQSQFWAMWNKIKSTDKVIEVKGKGWRRLI